MEGVSLKEVASRMYIAEKSAKFHNTCLIRKLKAGSRYGLIVLCYKMVLEELEIESREMSENYFKLLREKICVPIIEKEEVITLPRGMIS